MKRGSRASGNRRGRAARAVTVFAVLAMFLPVTMAVTAPAAAHVGAPGRVAIAQPGPAGLTPVRAGGPGAVGAAAPLGKYGSTLSFSLTSMSPLVVTSSGDATLTVAGTYTNSGQELLTDVGYKFQRGDPLESTAAIRQEVTDPGQPIAVIDSGFVALPGQLVPGLTAGFTATVPIIGDDTTTLAVRRPGVYPIMININATVHLADGPIRARVGELHLLLTVLSVPDQPEELPTPPTAPTPAVPFNMLWPIVDRPHLGVGGVFTDDDLVAEISPGGRLADLVDTLRLSAPEAGTVTLVLDPELLDELDRMTHGYWVSAHPGTPQPALTPTLNGSVTNSSAAPSSTGSTAPTTTSPAATSSSSGSGATDATSTEGTSTEATSTGGTSNEGNADGGTVGGANVGEANPGGSNAGATAGATTTGPPADTVSATVETQAAGATQDTVTAEDTVTAQEASQAEATGPTQNAGPAQNTVTAAPGSVAATGAPAPTSTPARAPGAQPAQTVAGTGSAVAAQFLDQLRTLARTYRVLVLPYSDPDSVALVRAGMITTLASAVYLGRAVASRVLQQGVPVVDATSHLITDVAYPVDGVADEATLQALAGVGYSSAVLSTSAVTGSRAAQGAVAVKVGAASMPVLLSDASLASDIGSFVYSGIPADWAGRTNLLAALLAQQHFDGTGTPIVLVPERSWSPNRDGVRFISSMLQVLAGQGVVAGTSLTDIAASAQGRPATARLSYPDTARSAELTPAYLSSLGSVTDRIGVLQEALSPGTGPEGADPADVLDPLQQALNTAASVSFRGEAEPDRLVLDTVNATLDGLYAGVSVRANGGSYTLASSRSPLPLTVQNSLPYRVTVGIQIVGGNRVGLTTHDPGRLELAAGPRSSQIKIDSEVSRSGTFTVYAQLLGPHGAPWGAAVPLTIASRAYGVLTLVLILVAGAVLVLMVVLRIHQRWRARRRRLAGLPDDEAVTLTPDAGMVGTAGAGSAPDPDSISGAEPLPAGGSGDAAAGSGNSHRAPAGSPGGAS